MIFYSLFAVGLLYVLWLFFLAVMNLKRAKDSGTITKTALYLGIPLVIAGYIVDFACNILVMTVLLLEIPRETTVTARLSRHIHDSPGTWRAKISIWFCSQILDEFDPSGCHCK